LEGLLDESIGSRSSIDCSGLEEDIFDVTINGMRTDEQSGCDLSIRLASRHQPQNLDFSFR
jgi:hypothetical protein